MGFSRRHYWQRICLPLQEVGVQPQSQEDPWRRKWHPIQYLAWKILWADCNPWWTAVHGATKSQTQLSDGATYTHVGGISVDECNSLIPNWPFHCYTVSFFIFLYVLCFRVCLVWCEFCEPWFLVISVLHPTTTDSRIFESLLPARREMIPDQATCPPTQQSER